MLIDSLFGFLAKLWAVHAKPERDNRHNGSRGTWSGKGTPHPWSNGYYKIGSGASRKNPRAMVYFGGLHLPEFRYRKEIQKRGIPEGIFVGEVISTIEECIKIKFALPDGVKPRKILLFTDKAHSRRCQIVWKTFFPDSKISIVSAPILETVDAESPMETYHKASSIFLLQSLPTPLFLYWSLRGPDYMATKRNFHQPTTKTA